MKDLHTLSSPQVTPQDMADTFQPPFEKCVQQGGASGIMCAYNRVNGVPNCADYNLLTKTARSLWGFRGYLSTLLQMSFKLVMPPPPFDISVLLNV